MADQVQGQQIQIKITDDVMKGTPANMMAVSHTKDEFVVDFINVYPAQRQGMVNARVIMTPGHVKRVLAALKDNVEKYEKQFGKIQLTEAPKEEIGFQTA